MSNEEKLEEFNAPDKNYALICHKRDCNSTNFKALFNGQIQCEYCKALYAYTPEVNGWVRIVTRPRTRKKRNDIEEIET